jgi:hypothetical protein
MRAWDKVPPQAQIGNQAAGEEWTYTVPTGMRLYLLALSLTNEPDGAADRAGYIDIHIADQLVYRFPATGNFTTHSTGFHYSYDLWPYGIENTATDATTTDMGGPMPDELELPAGSIIHLHTGGTTAAGDVWGVNWDARLVSV